MFDEFKNYLSQRDRSALTIRGYLSDMHAFRTWFQQTNAEELTPEGITPSDIKEYRQFLLTVERAKAATINRRLAALSAYLNWAVQAGQIENNPAAGIRSVQQVSAGPRYLGRKEQFALQRAVEKELQVARLRFPKRWLARQRDCALVVFLLNTGLRLNEALSLRLEDMQLTDRKGQVWVRQGKGGKQRMVPLNSDARRALLGWLNTRPVGASDFLWIAVESDQEQALSSRSVQRILTRIGRPADLPGLTPHMLRHSFAKNLIDSGVGLEKVAALLGHSSLNTTRLYVTPNQVDLERAVDLIANAKDLQEQQMRLLHGIGVIIRVGLIAAICLSLAFVWYKGSQPMSLDEVPEGMTYFEYMSDRFDAARTIQPSRCGWGMLLTLAAIGPAYSWCTHKWECVRTAFWHGSLSRTRISPREWPALPGFKLRGFGGGLWSAFHGQCWGKPGRTVVRSVR